MWVSPATDTSALGKGRRRVHIPRGWLDGCWKFHLLSVVGWRRTMPAGRASSRSGLPIPLWLLLYLFTWIPVVARYWSFCAVRDDIVLDSRAILMVSEMTMILGLCTARRTSSLVTWLVMTGGIRGQRARERGWGVRASLGGVGTQ